MAFVKIIDTVGSSPESWEAAARNAIEETVKSCELTFTGVPTESEHSQYSSRREK